MSDIDTNNSGGEGLTVDQAAQAYLKTTLEGTGDSQPNDDDEFNEGDTADDDLQSNENADEDDEGNPDDEGQPNDEEGEEPESDQGRFVASDGKVRLPDGSVSTVADLISGNLRDRDYRQKTMEVAEIRRQIDDQSHALRASQEQLAYNMEYVSNLMQAFTPPRPDASEINTDPISYFQKKDAYEQFAAHAAYIQQQMEAGRSQTTGMQEQQLSQLRDQEWEKLKTAVPSLSDEKKLQAFANDIKAAGQAAGFTIEEIRDRVPYDHRMALVLRKAAQWDRLQKSKGKIPEKAQNRPPVQRGGVRLSKDAQRGQKANDAMSRLKSSGSIEDAAAAYLASRKG